MRDPLCSESYLLETIEFDKEAIDENKKDIVELKMIWKRHTKISKRQSKHNLCFVFAYVYV